MALTKKEKQAFQNEFEYIEEELEALEGKIDKKISYDNSGDMVLLIICGFIIMVSSLYWAGLSYPDTMSILHNTSFVITHLSAWVLGMFAIVYGFNGLTK